MPSRHLGLSSLDMPMDAATPEVADLWRTALKSRKALQKQVDKNKLVPEVDFGHFQALEVLLANFRLACVATIFQNFEYAVEEKVEAALWHAHSLVNGEFRRALARLQVHYHALLVARRKVERAWQNFLGLAGQFYVGYIQRLARRFDIQELHLTARALRFDEGLDMKQSSEIVEPHLKEIVLQSCYSTVIRLGDLIRYQNQARPKTKLLQSAVVYYSLAHDLMPSSGHAYHQIGIVALSENNRLDVVYNFYRALAARTPHPIAQQNLETEFQSVIDSTPKASASRAGPTETLVKWFSKLHAFLYSDFDQGNAASQHGELENEIIHRLELLVKAPEDSTVRDIVLKMVLINFTAYHTAKIRKNETDPSNFELNAMRLSVRFITVLGSILTAELNSPDKYRSPSKDQEKWYTPAMDSVLPSLRLCCSWLVCYRGDFIDYGQQHQSTAVAEMHRSIAKAGTALLETVYGQKLETAPYLLEEDQMARGLHAFDSEELPVSCQLGYDEKTTALKPFTPQEASERLSEAEEARARIFDISRIIYYLAADEQYPLTVHLIQQEPPGVNFAYTYTADDKDLLIVIPGGDDPVAQNKAIWHSPGSTLGQRHHSALSPSVSTVRRVTTLSQFGESGHDSMNAAVQAGSLVSQQTLPAIGSSQYRRVRVSSTGSPAPGDRPSLASMDPMPRHEGQLDSEVEADLLRRLREFTMPPEAKRQSQLPSRPTREPERQLVLFQSTAEKPLSPVKVGHGGFPTATFPQLPWKYFVNPSQTEESSKLEQIFNNVPNTTPAVPKPASFEPKSTSFAGVSWDPAWATAFSQHAGTSQSQPSDQPPVEKNAAKESALGQRAGTPQSQSSGKVEYDSDEGSNFEEYAGASRPRPSSQSPAEKMCQAERFAISQGASALQSQMSGKTPVETLVGMNPPRGSDRSDPRIRRTATPRHLEWRMQRQTTNQTTNQTTIQPTNQASHAAATISSVEHLWLQPNRPVGGGIGAAFNFTHGRTPINSQPPTQPVRQFAYPHGHGQTSSSSFTNIGGPCMRNASNRDLGPRPQPLAAPPGVEVAPTDKSGPWRRLKGKGRDTGVEDNQRGGPSLQSTRS